MPKRKPGMTPDEQGQRFVDAAQRMIDAGELSPTEAQRGIELALRRPTKPIDPN